MTSEQELLNELNSKSAFWKPYQVDITDKMLEKFIGLQDNTWPVKNFIKTSVRVRGELSIKTVHNDVHVLSIDVISKSVNVRSTYFIILFENIILIEADDDDFVYKFFNEHLCPLLHIETAKELRINAMRIRSLAKKDIPTKLTILVNNQTAGVDGLENITLTGDNIKRGIMTLKDRQEVDLKADSIGPWVECSTLLLTYKLGKGIQLKEPNLETFAMLSKTLK